MEEKNKKSGKRFRLTDILIVLVFLAGLCVMLYPMASDYINRIQVERAIENYERLVNEASAEEYNALFEEARDYNRRLKKNPNPFGSAGRTEGYRETLLLGNSGIMGYVMIEKIRVRLPFYHGTEEDVLQTAIGHVEGSSLPVGDPGEHAVLSAHRGLPTAKLFTDLPELVPGDRFVVNVLNRRMVYEVDQIKTVLPDEITDLLPIEGEDLVTLMTCTPYGVNTHRLLVRGHRTADREHREGSGNNPGTENEAGRSFDRYIPYVAGAAVVIFLILMFAPVKKKKRGT